MKVKELLDKNGHDVYSVSPDTTAFDALQLMAEKKIDSVVVLEEEKLVGIMSERDYADKVILNGKKSKYTPVRDIMTSKVMYTTPEQTLNKCLSMMTKNRFRHLPVLDNGNLVGLLSIEDIKRYT